MPFSLSVLVSSSQTKLFGKATVILPGITPQNAFIFLLAHELFSFIYAECVFFKLGCVLGFLPVSIISLRISVVFFAWKLLRGLGSYLYNSHGIVTRTKRCCLNKFDTVGILLSNPLGIRSLRT